MEIVICRFCLKKFSVGKSGDYRCPHCGQRQRVSLAARPSQAQEAPLPGSLDAVIDEAVTPDRGVPGGTPGSGQTRYVTGGEPRVMGPVPWEEREQFGYIQAIIDTVTRIFKEPINFFKSLSPTGSAWDALFYGVIIYTVGALAATIWQLLFSLITPGGGFEKIPFGNFGGLIVAGVFVLLLILLPFFALLGLILGAAITHLFLMLFQGNTHGFNATLRIVCYSSTANLLNIIPFVGSIIGSIWYLVLLIIGIREVHETSTGKAVLVALFPILICCCVLLVVGLVFFSMIWQEIFQQRGVLGWLP